MKQRPNQIPVQHAEEKVYRIVSILDDGTIVYRAKIRSNPYKDEALRPPKSVKVRLRALLSIRRPNYDKALWCVDEWSHGYFHWFIDVLQRYFSVEHQGHTLLLPNKFSKLPYVAASLNILDIPYYVIGNNEVIKVDKLILPTYYKPRGTVFKELIGKIAGSFRCISEKIYRNRIYVSREFALRRRISNESEVAHLFIEHDFQVIHMERLSWLEQLSLSQQSSVIAGLHGAGLTNMLFMPPNSKVLEIMMKGSDKQICYRDLAVGLDHEYHCFIAESLSEHADPHVGDVVVDISQMKQLLAEVL